MNLIAKYNVPAPRYTSYPTVPYWDNNLTVEEWAHYVRQSFTVSNHTEGISLYIHLPYCESLCTYCACNTRITVNHQVEMPYIDAVLKEWDMYRRLFPGTPRIRELHLGGGTPTFFSARNLHYLIENILRSATVCHDAEFSFEAHPNNTTRAHLEALYELGFRRVSFGIQDFDRNVQEIIHRVQTYGQVRRAVEDARDVGYTSINFDLVYGLPLQTAASVADTTRRVNLLKPERIAFYSYAHVPWIKPGQRRFTEKDLPADDAKRQLYETGKALLLEAGYEEIGMDHFALPDDGLFQAARHGTLHRNFMGYTSRQTQLLIGLGVSSISDTWTAFSQNEKVVEVYLERIGNGELPIARGHVLTDEDLVLRRHILNIMCTGGTSWRDETLQCGYLDQVLESLQELEHDRLVELSPFHLKVTPLGKGFLRNICMCFDARYQRRNPGQTVFSNAV